MECHDIRLLLAFTRPGSDAIDKAERAAVEQHLEGCPDCAALVRSEEAINGAIGAAVRKVPIPAGLKARVLAKVAAARPRPWGQIAAAAAVLFIAIGLGGWYLRPAPLVDPFTVTGVFNARPTDDPEQVEKWFKDRGVEMVGWSQLDYRHLWSYDVVEFEAAVAQCFRTLVGQEAWRDLRLDRFLEAVEPVRAGGHGRPCQPQSGGRGRDDRCFKVKFAHCRPSEPVPRL